MGVDETPAPRLKSTSMRTVCAFIAFISIWMSAGRAQASGDLFELKAPTQKQGDFTFTILHRSLPDGGHSFHITIDDPHAAFDSEHDSTSIGRVVIQPDSMSVSPTRPIATERKGQTLICDFAVTNTDLADPALCFICTRSDRHGRTAVDFIYARLSKFLEAPPVAK